MDDEKSFATLGTVWPNNSPKTILRKEIRISWTLSYTTFFRNKLDCLSLTCGTFLVLSNACEQG